MAPGDTKRASEGPAEEGFEGRDLLVGLPEERTATVGKAAGSGTKPARAASRVTGPHDDADGENRETKRASAARESLEAAADSVHEAAGTLDGATSKLMTGIEAAQGVLAGAAELAAGRDGEAAAAARVLNEGVAELRAQGEALDGRLGTTGEQAQTIAEGLDKMTRAAEAFTSRLGFLSESISREIRDRRGRRRLVGLSLVAGAIAAFTLGGFVQRQTFVFTYGDARHEWNAFVVQHVAPQLAACASKAWLVHKPINCAVVIDSALPVTVPIFPDMRMRDPIPESAFEAKR